MKKICSITPRPFILHLPEWVSEIGRDYPNAKKALFNLIEPEQFANNEETSREEAESSSHTTHKLMIHGWVQDGKLKLHLDRDNIPHINKFTESLLNRCIQTGLQKGWAKEQSDILIMFKLEEIHPHKDFPGFEAHIDESRSSFLFHLYQRNLTPCPTQVIDDINKTVITEDSGPGSGLAFTKKAIHRGTSGKLVNPEIAGHRMLLAAFFELGISE